MTTVVEHVLPEPHHHRSAPKALTLNKPHPIVIGEPPFPVHAGFDEFRTMTPFCGQATTSPATARADHSRCDPSMNEYHVFYGVRNDKVEAVWPVTARGKSVGLRGESEEAL